MMDHFKTQVARALTEALAKAIPDTPSGSHRMLVVGQLVVNIQQTSIPTIPEFEHPHPTR